jgi:16S rRNA (guanine966-N2)-methyltransferase
MRIVAGKHKGRRIELLKEAGPHIRPTSEFAREAIFNILAHSKHGLAGQSFADQKVLDVFCGTGAFGLEALSRGVAHVTFIDKARDAIANAQHNAQRMKETETTDFITADATKLGRARQAYSLVFLDPPYFKKLLEPALKSLKEGGWLAPDALIIIEHDSKEENPLPEGFSIIDERRYGRAAIKLIKQISSPAA